MASCQGVIADEAGGRPEAPELRQHRLALKGTEWRSRSRMVAARLEALPPLVPPGLTPTAVRLISKTIHTLNKEDQGV